MMEKGEIIINGNFSFGYKHVDGNEKEIKKMDLPTFAYISSSLYFE
jgi:hypothetical protein